MNHNGKPDVPAGSLIAEITAGRNGVVTLLRPLKGVLLRFTLLAHLKKMIRRYGVLLLSIVTVLSGPRLVAQSYLIIENKGKAAVVRKMHDGDTYVMENGRLVGKRTDKSGLIPAPEFLPVFISVLGLSAHSFTVIGIHSGRAGMTWFVGRISFAMCGFIL